MLSQSPLSTGALSVTTEPVEFDAPPQTAPTINNVDPGETSAVVSYDGVADATGYEYRLDGGVWTDVGTTNPFTILGLTADTTYNSPGVELRGYNSEGAGPVSDPVAFTTDAEAVSAPESAPTNLSGTATSTQITWFWDAVTDATGYIIEYGPQGGTYSTQDVGDNLTYVQTGLAELTTYEARVRAYNLDGNGPYSDFVQATTLEAGDIQPRFGNQRVTIVVGSNNVTISQPLSNEVTVPTPPSNTVTME